VPPTNLPDEAAAERIARSLLEGMGITGDWSVTVDAGSGSGDAVVCAPEPCASPMHIVLMSRVVQFRPRFNGVAIDGLGWQVEIGDNGHVLGLSGTWADLRTLGRYPLRSVDAVFAELAAGRGIDPGPVPLDASESGGAFPFHEIKPVTVVIDHVTLGYAVMPAVAGGAAVVDIVPTYVFTGRPEDGGNSGATVSRTLVAVDATVTTPSTLPGSPKTVPGATNTIPIANPPLGRPEPQTTPDVPPTVGGTPPT
jgi:hypothetical protein